MKARRVLPAMLAVFIFIFTYEWLFHGILLRGLYEATPQLWRTKQVMPQYFPYLFGSQFLMAVFLALIFSRGYENRGINEGVRFGLLVGLLLASGHIMWYAVQPILPTLVVSWVLGSIVEMIVVGILLALICRPKTIA